MTLETDNKPIRLKQQKTWRSWRTSREANAASQRKYPNITKGFAKVEKMFYYYPRIKDAVVQNKKELGYYQSGAKEGGGSSNHAFISDPTFQMAVKHMAKIPAIIFNADKVSEERVECPEDWMIVVEQTLDRFSGGPPVAEVLRRRYFKNEAMPHTCIDLEITESKYYRCRNIGINYARECAIQLGLIKVF